MLTGGHPCSGIYRCGDGRLIALASAEPEFLAPLHQRTGLKVPPKREALVSLFATQPRDHWVELLASACVTPLLELDELLETSLVASRGVLGVGSHGLWACPPAGRPVKGPAPALGAHSRQELEAAGVSSEPSRRG